MDAQPQSPLRRRPARPQLVGHEHDAFRRLQKLASDKNKKLVEIARIILTAEEAKDYGLVDQVVTSAREAADDGRPARQKD